MPTIEIKIDTALIIIHDSTQLTDWDLPKFKKTMRLAFKDKQNDAAQLREQIIEKLESERKYIDRALASIKEENELFEYWANDRCTITYCRALDKIKAKHDKQRDKMINRCNKSLELIDKYKGVVNQWDI